VWRDGARRGAALRGGAGRDVAWLGVAAWRGVWCCRGTNKEQVVGTERGVGSAPTNKGVSGVAYVFGAVCCGAALCCVVLCCVLSFVFVVLRFLLLFFAT